MDKFGAKIHDFQQPKSTTPLEQQPPKTNDYLAADAGGTRQHWVHNLEPMTLAKSALESAVTGLTSTNPSIKPSALPAPVVLAID